MPADTRKKILVVDDDQSIRTAMVRLLSPLYDLVVVASGASALREMSQWQPDLLLLDLCMPEMDGWELIARLEGEGRDVPVVVMSASTGRPWPSSKLVRSQHMTGDSVDLLVDACARILGVDDDDCA